MYNADWNCGKWTKGWKRLSQRAGWVLDGIRQGLGMCYVGTQDYLQFHARHAPEVNFTRLGSLDAADPTELIIGMLIWQDRFYGEVSVLVRPFFGLETGARGRLTWSGFEWRGFYGQVPPKKKAKTAATDGEDGEASPSNP